jgi:hypothetical protein
VKLPNLKKWKINKETEGLLFFAQALDEMLFHHSIDSFKAPALNIHSNLYELLFFSFEFSRGTAQSKKSFSHVIEELSYNLSNDPIISHSDDSIFKELNSKIQSLEHPLQFEKTVSALHAEFEHNYWNKLIRYLLDKVPECREKGAILKAIKSFCAEVELRGFSREYLYKKTQDFFFSTNEYPGTIDKRNQLKEFLDLFQGSKKVYDVYLKAKIPVKRYGKHLEKFDIFVIESTDENFTKLGTCRLLKKDREGYEGYNSYIFFKEIEALDPYSARELALMRVKMIYDAYTFLDHKTKLYFHPSCIALEKKDPPVETFLRVRPHPMEKASIRNEIPNDILEKSFDSLFDRYSNQATAQLLRVFDYHRAAISTDAPESQLISLWAALEGLFPIPSKGERGINHYLKLLIPALVLTYPEKIFSYVSDAFKHAGENSKQIIQNNGFGKTFFEKSTSYLVTKETSLKAKELTDTLGNNPLLRHRCFWCNEHFCNTTAIYKSIQSHRQRLSWHFRRIYLARNQILHNDRTLPYLPTLVENLHSYLDIIIRSILKIGERAKGHKISIDTAYELLETHEKIYLNALKNRDISCEEKNYKEIIFGANNPLSPFYSND